MLKKISSFVILFVLVMGCLLTGCTNKTPEQPVCETNKFEIEMESLNGKDNGYGGSYLTIDIPSNNKIKYATYQDVESMLTFGTGVIYFGFPECPWCRNLVPTLLKVANEYETTVLYFNNRDERDTKKLENGEIQLTSALETVRSQTGMMCYVVAGKSYDIGLPEKYYETMLIYSK